MRHAIGRRREERSLVPSQLTGVEQPGKAAEPADDLGPRRACYRRRHEVDGAIARLLAIVAGAAEQGELDRLKACPRDVCHWAFYDHSKNRSGRWCQMDVCGNIEKARAFRERKRAAH